MIGSPQNNFKTMQPPQTMPQPRNVMLSNALRQPQGNDQEENRPQEQYETDERQEQYRQPLGDRSIQGYRQPSQTWQPSMMSPNQYGQPTPTMPSWVRPQSNASFNMQPQIPNMNQTPQGPIGMNQMGQNRFGVGLAKPQNTQVS